MIPYQLAVSNMGNEGPYITRNFAFWTVHLIPIH